MHAELSSHSGRQNTETRFIMHMFIIISIHLHQMVLSQATIVNDLLNNSVLFLAALRKCFITKDTSNSCISWFHKQMHILKPTTKRPWSWVRLAQYPFYWSIQTENTNTSVPLMVTNTHGWFERFVPLIEKSVHPIFSLLYVEFEFIHFYPSATEPSRYVASC